VEKSVGGVTYAVVFTGDATRWRTVYFTRAKSETLTVLKRYTQGVGVLMKGKKLKELRGLRSDSGGEHVGGDFKALCKSQGVKQQFTGPHSPEESGVAERSWRSVASAAKCLREQSGLPKRFWAEAASTAVSLVNRTPTAVLGGSTPYRALFKKHANLSHLKPFGCRAYAHYCYRERKKLGPKAWRGYTAGRGGTNTRCYRVYNPAGKKLFRSVHVTFDEYSFPARSRVSVSGGQGEELAKERTAEQVGASPAPATTSASDGAVKKVVEATRELSKEPEPAARTPPSQPVWATGWKLLGEVTSRPQTCLREVVEEQQANHVSS